MANWWDGNSSRVFKSSKSSGFKAWRFIEKWIQQKYLSVNFVKFFKKRDLTDIVDLHMSRLGTCQVRLEEEEEHEHYLRITP